MIDGIDEFLVVGGIIIRLRNIQSKTVTLSLDQLMHDVPLTYATP